MKHESRPMATNEIDRWAVLIGINGYHESLGPLKYSVNDCRRLAGVLTTGDDAFPTDHVLVLADDEAAERKPTYANIHSWLASWFVQPNEDDTILVFFAGHGREMDGKCYLVPGDATLDTIHVTGIPVPYVQELLNRCRARQKVLILDCCHSGAGRDVSTMPAPMMETLSAGKGIYTLASCDVDERSHEWDEKEQGVFSYYLAEALAGSCPLDDQGQVTVDGVYEWVFKQTRDWTRAHRCSQSPRRVCDASGTIVLRCSEPDWRKVAAGLQSQLAETRREVERLKSRESQQKYAEFEASMASEVDIADVLNDWASRRLFVVKPLVDGKDRSIVGVAPEEYVRVTVWYMCETREGGFKTEPGPPEPGEEPNQEKGKVSLWDFGSIPCPDGWTWEVKRITCIPAFATGACNKCQGKKPHSCEACKGTGIQTKYRTVEIELDYHKATSVWERSHLGAHVDAVIPEKAAWTVLLDETRVDAEAPEVSTLPQLVEEIGRDVPRRPGGR